MIRKLQLAADYRYVSIAFSSNSRGSTVRSCSGGSSVLFLLEALVFLIDNNFISGANVVAVQPFVGIFHLFEPLEISQFLVDIK